MAPSYTCFSFQITLRALFTFSILTVAFSAIPKKNSHPFKKIFAFGDSFTDTGNSQGGGSVFGSVSNPPYGMTFFHHPTNRYSDGRLVIDFVAETLSLPYLPPYRNLKGKDTTYGVNFAAAGSTAINHAFFVKNNLSLDITTTSIQTQLIWFNEFLESQGCTGSAFSSLACKALFDDALIWVGEIGANDYAYIVGSSTSRDTILKLALSSVTGFLKALLNKGVKHMVVQGLPLSGCLPLTLYLAPEKDRDDMGCVRSENNQSYIHSAAYQTILQELRSQFPNTVITYLDYWNAYHAIMKDPERYGFKEAFKACCGSGDPPYNFNLYDTCGMLSTKACTNPSQYINWDGVHLTEAMYKVLATMFINGTYSHPPLGSLLGVKQL